MRSSKLIAIAFAIGFCIVLSCFSVAPATIDVLRLSGPTGDAVCQVIETPSMVTTHSESSYYTQYITDNTYDDASPQIDSSSTIAWIGNDYDNEDDGIWLWDGMIASQIWSSEDDIQYLDFDDGMLSWIEYQIPNKYSVYLHDGIESRRIALSEHQIRAAAIDNGMVTWWREYYDSSLHSEVWLYDGEDAGLLWDGTGVGKPQIDNGIVVWHGQGVTDTASEIWLYQGGLPRRITSNTYWDYNPKIDSGLVVWCSDLDVIGASYNLIELYDIAGDIRVTLTSTLNDLGSPQICEGRVVWAEHDGNDYEIWLWDRGDKFQITNNLVDDMAPQIDEYGVVTWRRDNGANNEICLNSETDPFTSTTLTSSSYDLGYPQINKGIVTWTESDGYDYEIWWYGPDSTLPTISEPPDMSTSEGSSEFISWNAYDQLPGIFSIYLEHDGTTSVGLIGPWANNVPIQFDPSNLAPGTYTIECVVQDTSANTASDSVIVYVYSSISWIFEPTNQQIIYGEPFDYQLSVSSINPIESWLVAGSSTHFEIKETYSPTGSTCRIKNKTNLEPGDYPFEIFVSGTNGHYLTGEFVLTVVRHATTQLELKLSGSFDYLLKEKIHFQIAALLTDRDTGEPISGATVTMDLYHPNGELWVTQDLIEENSESGVYVHTSPLYMKDMNFPKGIYWVYARASIDGMEAIDMIQFHVDPPGETSDVVMTWLPPAGLAALAFFGGAIGVPFVRKKMLKRGK